MQGGYFPNAKKPFNPAYFQLIYEKFTPTNIPDQKLFFLITLSYYCFLRISEVINLKKCDINNGPRYIILRFFVFFKISVF